MVVEDIEIIPPKNKLSVVDQPKCNPALYPIININKILVKAVMIADFPTLTIFLKLNSKPKLNSRNITPMSAQI